MSTNPIAGRHARRRKETTNTGTDIFKRFSPYLSRQKKPKAISEARLGKRIKSAKDVARAIFQMQSIAVPSRGLVLPAACVPIMQFKWVNEAISEGMFVYRKAVAK